MPWLCVFMGSTSGNNSEFQAAAQELAVQMARRNIGLVYGGSSDGLMGQVANTVLANGGQVKGVLSKTLLVKEKPHQGLTELIMVDDMQERKRKMIEISDGFLAIPGGLGTMEELFEVWNAAKVGDHHKPVGVLNIRDYFTPIIQFARQAVSYGFATQSAADLLQVATTPGAFLQAAFPPKPQLAAAAASVGLGYKMGKVG